jgi:hypothetical protein
MPAGMLSDLPVEQLLDEEDAHGGRCEGEKQYRSRLHVQEIDEEVN